MKVSPFRLYIEPVRQGPEFLSTDLAFKVIEETADIESPSNTYLYFIESSNGNSPFSHIDIVKIAERACRIGYNKVIFESNNPIQEQAYKDLYRFLKIKDVPIKDRLYLSVYNFDIIAEILRDYPEMNILYPGEYLGQTKVKVELPPEDYNPDKKCSGIHIPESKEIDILPKPRKMCCGYTDSITLRANGKMYQCPLNENEDVLIGEDENISLVYIFSKSLREQLNNQQPQPTCKHYCKTNGI